MKIKRKSQPGKAHKTDIVDHYTHTDTRHSGDVFEVSALRALATYRHIHRMCHPPSYTYMDRLCGGAHQSESSPFNGSLSNQHTTYKSIYIIALIYFYCARARFDV